MLYDEFLTKVQERHSALNPLDTFANLQRFQFLTEKGSSVLSPLEDVQLSVLPKRLEDATLSIHALQQLCGRLNVPYSFLKRCPDNLQYLLVNYFIQHGGYDKEVMLRIIRENQLRAIMSERYTPCDDIELFPLIEPWVRETKIEWYHFDEYSTHVRLTLASGDPKRLKEHVKYMIEEAVLDSDSLLDKYKQSLEVAIEEPVSAIKQIAKKEGLTQVELKELLDVYLKEPNPSLFGICNALALSAQEYPAERRWEMENIAGKVLDSGLE